MADNVAITAGSGTIVAADELTDGTLGSVKVQYVKLMDGTIDGTNKGVISSTGLRVDGGTASGATNAGNPFKAGGVYNSTQPTVTNGQIVDIQATSRGALIVGNGTEAFNVTVNTSLPAGSNNIGDVDVLTVPAPLNVTGTGTEASALRVTIATDSTGVISIDDNGGSLTIDGTVAATQSGTWVLSANSGVDIGDVTINNASGGSAVNIQDGGNSITIDGTVTANLAAGTNNIGDVDVLSVIPGTGATNLGKAIDSVVGATDTGVAMLAKRSDEDNVITAADGDYAIMRIDSRGSLKASPEQHIIFDTLDATTGWTALGNDTANLAVTTKHVTGTGALTFDKVNGAANTVFAGIQKTITTASLGDIAMHDLLQVGFYIPDITNVAYVFIRLGTDSSNYNEWRIPDTNITQATFITGAVGIGDADYAGITGNGWNPVSISYIAVGVAFDAETNTLAGLVFDRVSFHTNLHTSASFSAEISSDVTTPNVNIHRVGGVAAATNAGVNSNGTLRVTIATDDEINDDLDAIKTAVEIIDNAISGSEMQVDVITLPSLPAGTNNIGDVDVLTVPAPLNVTGTGTEASALRVTIATDSTGVLSIDDNGGSLTVDGTVAATQSGTWTLSANSGVDIGDVTINNAAGGSAVNIQDGGNSITIDGTVSVTGVATETTLASLLTSSQLIDDTVQVLGTDTFTEATSKGITLSAVRRDADTTLVGTTNEFGPLQMDALGRLKVEVFSGESLPVTLTSTTITGTVAATQSGTWILGANSGVDIGDVTINNASGGSAVNIQDGGNSITVDGTVAVTGVATESTLASLLTSSQLIDDTVTVLGTDTYTEATSKGLTIGAVRRDADTTLVNTTNEFGPLQMDANGRLKVEVFSGESLPVTLTSTTITGTVAATQSGTWILGANNAVDIGDVTINNASGGSAVNIQDGGNSITVDGTVAVTGVATETTLGSVLTSVQLIDDPVVTLGTTTYTEATSKGFSIGAVRRDADTTLVDTTNEFGPLQMDANGRLKVEVFSGESLPVTLTSTTITGTVAATQSGTWILGANNAVDIGDVTINNASGGAAVNIQDGGNSITIDAPIGTPANVQIGNATLVVGVIDETGASAVDALAVGGGTAHDAVDSGNPIKIGGKAASAAPTPVAAADRVEGWFDLNGRQVVSDQDIELGLTSGRTGLRDNLVAQRYTVLADSLADGINAFWTSTTANGGTTTSTGGEGVIQTSANASGSAQLTSTVVNYYPGQVTWFNNAIRVGDTGSAGNVRRWGVFTVSGTTPQDGFYYELSGTTLNAVICNAGTPTAVASGSWSRNAVAPFTLDTNFHFFEIRFTGNTAWFYIDNVLRHSVSGTNVPITATLNFPMTLHSVNSSGATNRVLAARNVGIGRFGTPETQGVKPVDQAAAAAITQVTSSATNVTLKASNTARTGLLLYNDSSAVVYVKFGATASTTSFTIKIAANSYYEVPRPVYTGIVDAIWASANGFMYVTELT